MFTLLNSDHLGLKAVKKNICGCHMPACLPYPMAACGGADGLRPPPFSQHRGDNIFRGLGGTMNGIKKNCFGSPIGTKYKPSQKGWIWKSHNFQEVNHAVTW